MFVILYTRILYQPVLYQPKSSIEVIRIIWISHSKIQKIAFTCNKLEATKPMNTLEEDMIKSLSNRAFSLPPKYLYNDRGSELFEQICNSKDYYLTREENKLLQEKADYLIAKVQPEHIVGIRLRQIGQEPIFVRRL